MNNTSIDNNLLKQIFFIAVIIFLGVVLFSQLQTFLPAFLGAVTFYVLMRKRMFHLVEKKKWKAGAAAWVLMLLSFFVILVPVGLLGNILYSKISFVVAHSDELIDSLKIAAEKISDKIGYKLIDPNNMNKLANFLAQLLPKILGVTFDTLTQVASMYFILYFMLVNGRCMEKALYEYIPLKDNNVVRLATEMHTLIVSSAIGIPLIAFVQGIAGLIGYLIIGINEPWLWFVATTIAAIMPVVGAAVIYVPLTIMLLVQGHTGKGIIMAIWGFGVIGLIDNVFRLLVNKKLGDIHPLITIFGVIIGVQLFGFIGLIFGPILIALFLLLLRIYSSEFIVKKREIKP
ncbi:AI-2E family transporter [Flavisolibacter ginsenosidimutans]|uniref:AI-2E family transporter n=1 Tax=Flavisolibacter ginsenosidimutans TaxID=661481 RepID=A0A5B8ULM3_9BACT|nr:AI-2E family transporter [Flavisolibacter ginsenosidimutans]QEC56950.1 AI-2E family transporter [Flavisolibacter ginsenosidimutans]